MKSFFLIALTPLLTYSVSAAASTSAPSEHAKCQTRLLKVTSDALYAELPKHNWDVGQIFEITYNYNLARGDRTVFQCVRASNPREYCIVEVYTRSTEHGAASCPDYQVDEVTSNCN